MNGKLKVLHLEDNLDDADLIRIALNEQGLDCVVVVAKTAEEFQQGVNDQSVNVVLSDSSVPGFDGISALKLTREKRGHLPFIFVSGNPRTEQAQLAKANGATDYLSKDRLSNLASAIRQACEHCEASQKEPMHVAESPTDRLIHVIQRLSMVRDLQSILEIVRHAARDLTGADGATFVLREGQMCFYADEDAIAPLWKGRRFPMENCISGWVMKNKEAVVIPDIFADQRIPKDAYQPTFVKSLAMVPIRTVSPVGAIGAYWATTHRPTKEELKFLQALADSTSIAMENVRLYSELQQRVHEKASELEAAGQDTDAFAYSISHDLRAPLRGIAGFSQMLVKYYAHGLDSLGMAYLNRIVEAAQRMGQLIEDLLAFVQLQKAVVNRQSTHLTPMIEEIIESLQESSPPRNTEITVGQDMTADCDPGLLHVVLENLLSNAWKYTSKMPMARIEIGQTTDKDGKCVYFVRDNGAGFEPKQAGRLFGVFQRLHLESEFPGTGVGLAMVQRIIQKHGGRVWAEAELHKGATFYFTLE